MGNFIGVARYKISDKNSISIFFFHGFAYSVIETPFLSRFST